MSARKEVIFSDLGSLCGPAGHISEKRERFKWNAVPYETDAISGTMLVSMPEGRPENVVLEPKLQGWYRIWVGLGCYSDSAEYNLNLKLSGDEAFMHFMPSAQASYGSHSVQECFWRCADMTGQAMEIGKYKAGVPSAAILAWIRFAPMEEEEVQAFLADQKRTDTKRLYATNDMHGMLWAYGLEKPSDWRSIVQDYQDSDVEWLSVENILIFDGEPSTGNSDNFAFCRSGDQLVQERLKRDFTPEMLSDLMAFGRRQGIKMCISMRMGAWGMEFPYDQMYFTNAFMEAHPELRCVDRDGTPIDALSYCYPQVQEYIIQCFADMAVLGCDAVEMIFSRGVPYVLFEQPFCELFEQRYGMDPRYLPLDDERVTDLRCQIMTDFVRKLRARMDQVRPGLGIHARAQFCLWDCRHVGVDLETWAREGLISAIISYPQRIREVLTGDIWQDAPGGLLDLEKYRAYARGSQRSIIYRKQDENFMPPMADSKGVLQGPATQEERIAEFMALEHKYGTTVYLEILPRTMSTEAYRDRALELYHGGCGHISLWDTYVRAPKKVDWSMLRRLGHKDELAGYDSGEGVYYRTVRLLKIGGKDVSRYIPAWGG